MIRVNRFFVRRQTQFEGDQLVRGARIAFKSKNAKAILIGRLRLNRDDAVEAAFYIIGRM